MIWRHPLAIGGAAVAVLVALALPVLGLHTAMPSTGVLPAGASARVGAERLAQAFGPGAADELQVVAPADRAGRVVSALRRTPGVVAAAPERHDGLVLVRARGPVDRIRAALPEGARVGGAPAEARDLEH